MARPKDNSWLVFGGADIQRYLVCRNMKAMVLAETLNVSAPTLNRWSTGSAPPSGPSVLILAILLRSQGCAVLQDSAPAWWRCGGQRKRGRESKAVGGKPANKAGVGRKEDCFQFQVDKGRVREIGISPTGLRSAAALVEILSESVDRSQSAKSKTQATNQGHLLGLDSFT